jgi:hypothetical protein
MRSSIVAILLVLTSSAALAQQAGETIGHPPPLPGPPPIAEPSNETKPQTTAPPSPQAQPAKQGYIGAYGPSGPATPYSTGALPSIDTGAGRSVAAPDGSTKTVRAVPCGGSARETDGFTTCVGIPDDATRRKRR